MIHCLNPACPGPTNPDSHRFCQSCGWRLRLGDRYEAVYSVGQGQNSQTFVGRDRATLVNAQCLIKRFTPVGATVLERDKAAERFRQEVEQLAIASRHAQIPDLFAYFEREEQQFLVQQFLVGPHLEQRLQEKLGPLDSDEVRRFLRNVLPVLHHLHQNRLIHRDIKPSNFRQPPGQTDWWLVDFGAVKPVTATQMAKPGTLIGSADYASPEQLRGEATYASDLYSLGVVCLHLLTGLHPFDLFDGVNGCWQWRSIVPDVTPSLATLIDGMVQPALRDRLPDVATVMASLGMPLPTAPDPVPASRRQGRSWQPEATVDLGFAVLDMAILPTTGQLLLLTADGKVEMRSLAQLGSPGVSLTPEVNVTAIAAHPQQPLFVTGDRAGQLSLWEIPTNTWQPQRLDKVGAAISQLCFPTAGTELLVGDDQGQIVRWHWQTGQSRVLGSHLAKITQLALSRDNSLLASGDSQGSIKLWQWQANSPLRTLSRQPGGITAISWLPQDQTLVTTGWDVTLRWRDVNTGGVAQLIQAQGFALPVRSLLAHPTESWVVTGSQDGQLQLWESGDTHPDAHRSKSAIAQAEMLPGAIVALCPLPPKPDEISQFLCLTSTGRLTRWTWQ